MAKDKRTLGLEDLKAAKNDAEKVEVAAEAPEQSKSAEIKEEKKAEKKENKPAVKKVKGAKHQKAAKQVDSSKVYTLTDAVAAIKKAKYASFDESVQLHLNVDKTGLKGEVELPHSTGKTVRVAIVSDALLNDLENGKFEFDILITHPSFMPKLAKYARILGPKGLMPNPKAGTISPNPEEVAKKFEKGTLRWKTEPKFPLIHQMIGKVSYDDAKLVENAKAFIEAVGKLHISAAFMTGTMTPSVKLDLEKV